MLAEESEAVGEEWRGKKRWRARHLMTGENFLLHSWREGERGGEAIKRELALTPLRTARTQLRGSLPAQSSQLQLLHMMLWLKFVKMGGGRVKSSRQ